VCVYVCVFSTYLLMYLTGCEVVLVGGWRDLDVPYPAPAITYAPIQTCLLALTEKENERSVFDLEL